MYKIYTNYGINEVLNYYLDTIGDAMIRNGDPVTYIKDFRDVRKSDTLVVSDVVNAAVCSAKGYGNIILWIGGLAPEESFMRNGSALRKNILDFAERFALSKAKYIFCVSDRMRDHLANKHSLDIANKTFVMPCFNTDIHEECFTAPQKYKRNVFAYVGSLGKWQCFEDMIDFYKQIEMQDNDCELRIFTFDITTARNIVMQKVLKRCTVECVKNDQLPEKLKDVKFGFVLRRNHIVNDVATPTKLSTYLACGVIPIYSDCLNSFDRAVSGLKYVLPTASLSNPDIVRPLLNVDIDCRNVYAEYKTIFADYYNRTKYVAAIAAELQLVR